MDSRLTIETVNPGMLPVMIPHSKPFIHPDDILAVTAVLESGMLTGGDSVPAFEETMASYVGCSAAATVSSGTAGLYAIFSALGICGDDEVVIPSYVCSSLLYAVRMAGAQPVLADSGNDPFHMDRGTVQKALTPKTKAIVFPHMFGSANDLSDIIALGTPVIEDCAMSLGSEFGGVKSGALGSVASMFSFYATKVIASGEGGMVVSDDSALVGRVRDMVKYADKPDDRMRFNFAMTDIAAALGLSQLARLESMLERRRLLASRYADALQGTRAELPRERPGERHIFYRYVVRTDEVDNLRKLLHEHGVCAERPVFLPLSRYPGCECNCPRAEEAWRTALSIPLYPALTDTEAETVIQAAAGSLHDIA